MNGSLESSAGSRWRRVRPSSGSACRCWRRREKLPCSPPFPCCPPRPLPAADVLILIRSSTPGPALLSAPTHLATSYLFLPLSPSELSDPRDRYLLKLAKAGLSEAQGRLWWSPARDLTDTLDRTYKKREADGRPMWETVRCLAVPCRGECSTLIACSPPLQSEDRFFFNKHLQAPLISAAAQGGAQAAVLARFILPVIFGSASASSAFLDAGQALTSPSPRSRRRPPGDHQLAPVHVRARLAPVAPPRRHALLYARRRRRRPRV